MVFYGPWRQDPNVEQGYSLNGPFSGSDPGDGQPLFDYGATGVHYETEFQDPAFSLTPEILEEAVIVASPSGPGGSGGDAGTVWGTIYGWTYTLSFPEWATSWNAGSVHRSFRIMADVYAYNPPNYGYTDPDAIGIDYINRPYDPDNPFGSGLGEVVGRVVETTYTRLGGEWYNDAETSAVPDASTTVWLLPVVLGASPIELLTVPKPTTPNLPAEPQYRTLTTQIDLMPSLGATLDGIIWTEQSPEFAPPGEDPGFPHEGTVAYGWGFDRMRIGITVRPPLYRWVYAEDVDLVISGSPGENRRRFA